MQYTEQQLAESKAEFAKRRKRQLLATIPIVAVFVVAMVLRGGGDVSFLGIPASVVARGVVGGMFALVLGSIAFSLWNWRCPGCNRYLGKGISPSFCSKCGVPLQ
jgi:protein-S-isoprenylcysteine O-methyltransferase Ste14